MCWFWLLLFCCRSALALPLPQLQLPVLAVRLDAPRSELPQVAHLLQKQVDPESLSGQLAGPGGCGAARRKAAAMGTGLCSHVFTPKKNPSRRLIQWKGALTDLQAAYDR